MIFVTVGTHEKPFDRLIKKIDELISDGKITEKVFMQIGYCNYHPQHCKYLEFLTFKLMEKKIREAKIVITHGGTGTIMQILYHGKFPVVVPRQKKFKEHVDDHQVFFARRTEKKKRILAVYNIEDLWEKIKNYDQNVKNLGSLVIKEPAEQKAVIFAEKLEAICAGLLKETRQKE
jgi:UDP-N-acetylglucosamine transferase subunit ALG13